ncbi:MAG: SDR family NAD(P)-dependent oxidoreductase [Geodermatophilaceae bacterium]|nr:SDR family NAD(P)-dependent oxidoreductase [Geodermatophilaceae bacterium]
MPAPRSVLITGCSSGIGHATAAHLAAHGWSVYATARSRGQLADLESAGCHTLVCDVTDEASMQAAVDEVQAAEDGGVGALVNNAGYSQSGALETVSIDAARRQFETNVFGMLRMSQLVLPGMRERGAGRIVNMSSMGGRFTFPGGGIYHASKYAVEAISDALRFEVKGFGVDVVVIQPGIIRTGFSAAAVASLDAAPADSPYAGFNAAVAESTKSVYEKGPMARLGGGPGSVARAVEKALTARSPRIRYRVTPSARLLMTQRRVMSDRLWDRFLGVQFPRPGTSS